MDTFSFRNLIPDFCQIQLSFIGKFDACHNVDASPAEGISAVIVGLLIILAFGFLIFSLIKFFQSRRHIFFYLKLLDGLTQPELARKRIDVRQNSEVNAYFNRLWVEFDESLVVHKDANEDYKLSNTLDAAHFFNTHSLARGLTENRLLASVPGLLTAIGVIGTFAGLQMGLAGIDLSSDDIGRLKDGIRNMISGASIAFLTSLWGIALSVVFNISEKALERSVRGNINKLQNRVDFLYPRINAEQSLVEIANTSKVSTETMQGLAEQIGNRMQEAMVQAGETISAGIKDSLHEVLSPALEKMATDAHAGSEKALESMLNRFMDGFGQAGVDQRDLMDKSSKEVKQAVGELGSQMAQFINSLDERSRDVDEKNRLQREQLEKVLEGYESQNDERQQKMAGQFEDLMGKVSGGVNEQLEKQSLFHKERHDLSVEQMAKMQSSQEELDDSLESLLAFQKQSHKQLYDELTVLQEGFQQVASANREAAKNIETSSDKMKAASLQLSSLGTKINEASSSLELMVEKATSSTNELAQRNIASIEKLETVLDQYQQFAVEITRTSETLNKATEHAEKGFTAVDQHLESFQKAMKTQATEMQQQMEELMTNFSEQVKAQTVERIQVWTDETSKYTSVMTKAINTIADVVDDIEDKAVAS